jgi:hypothetical protein
VLGRQEAEQMAAVGAADERMRLVDTEQVYLEGIVPKEAEIVVGARAYILYCTR